MVEFFGVRAIKKPRNLRGFSTIPCQHGRHANQSHGADVLVHAGFMPCGLVLVHDAFADHAINDGYGAGQCGCGVGLIAGIDGGVYTLDVGANHGTLAGVLASSTFCLTGALAGLWAVCQGIFLRCGIFEARNMPLGHTPVNPGSGRR